MIVRIEPLGELALRIDLPVETHARAALRALRAIPGVTDAVVTERHACVYFDGEPPARDSLLAAIATRESTASAPATHVVRVRYDGEDLAFVASQTGLAIAEVIRAHTATAYEARAIGFLPGFAYLGDLDARLVLPRRASPRPRVPAGAVAIAAHYTAIYPFASPGGWHLVGTAVDTDVFDADRGARIALGDRVRFEAVR
jgi:UPF0271 protein